MKASQLRRLAVPAVCVAAFAGLALAVSAGAAPPSKGGGNGGGDSRQTLKGTQPSWTAAVPQSGTVSAGQKETAKVWLASQNSAQLASLAQAVSDPSSSQYRHFLTHDQYVTQFAPTSAQVKAVEGWLQGVKLKVTSVGADNHYVEVSGTAAQMASAFGAQLGLYTVNGDQTQAPTSDLSVPSSVASSVAAVTGLSTLGHQVKPLDLGAPAAFVNSTQCSSYYGQQKAQSLPKFQNQALPFAPCGYTPSQLRGAYGVPSSLNGAGQTVAITDAFDASTLLSDANTYATRHGDPAFASGQFSDNSVPEGASNDPNPIAACGGNGWYGEQTLDIEAVHGMATGANVAYYGAASCYDDDLLAALARVVADDKASIVTDSWGEPSFVEIDGTLYWAFDPASISAYDSVFQQGAVEGIGFYFSSGDFGDEGDNAGYVHPDWPAGDQWVTAVGGTSLAIGNGNTRLFETGWGTSKWSLSGTSWVQSIPFQYGAGGGYSQFIEEPWYQQGLVSSPTGGRAVPDIAMDADPTTGMLVGETQSFSLASSFGPAGVHYGEYRIGGTSLASPLFAGVEAVVQQGAGARIGFANPMLYGLKAQSNGQSTFYDPKATGPDAGNVRADYANGQNADGGTVYSVRTFDQDSSLNVAKGWDDVTGVGTVTARYISQVAGK